MTINFLNGKISDLHNKKEEIEDVLVNKDDLQKNELEELSGILVRLEKYKVELNQELLNIINTGVLPNIKNEIDEYNNQHEQIPLPVYHKLEKIHSILDKKLTKK